MMQKSTTFTRILRVKKCHFLYDMQKNMFLVSILATLTHIFLSYSTPTIRRTICFDRTHIEIFSTTSPR
jgi:hypothetical protein